MVADAALGMDITQVRPVCALPVFNCLALAHSAFAASLQPHTVSQQWQDMTVVIPLASTSACGRLLNPCCSPDVNEQADCSLTFAGHHFCLQMSYVDRG